jgi:Flp pilus assembly protein TadD
MDTGNAQAYEAIGCAHLRLDEHKKAEEYLRQAQELEPENPTILRNLSVLYSQTARSEESLELLERSYEINPEDYLTQYALASAYLFYRRREEAKKILYDLLQNDVPEEIRKSCEERYLQLSVNWL